MNEKQLLGADQMPERTKPNLLEPFPLAPAAGTGSASLLVSMPTIL